MPYWFDGNNLIGLSAAAARADRRSRAAFLSALHGWRSTGGGRFLVWFDGDDPADMRPPPGVTVRYSAPESADAAICRRLREIERPGEVIIVTNDRELASRCRNNGANALDWNRFMIKMQARSEARQTHHTPVDTSVDVDDWMRFFGVDEPPNGGSD